MDGKCRYEVVVEGLCQGIDEEDEKNDRCIISTMHLITAG